MKTRLERITIRGFRSIKDLSEFPLENLNVLIGPNGAGKSNFIAFFRLLRWALQRPGQLRTFVGEEGGAAKQLFDGPSKTTEIRTHLNFRTDQGLNEYKFRLTYAAGDSFIFPEEEYRFSSNNHPGGGESKWISLGAGHNEAKLPEMGLQVTGAGKTASVIFSLLKELNVYQFHNTSNTSRMKQMWLASDYARLKQDGANLAPFLYKLSQSTPIVYNRIVSAIQLILPFFAGFELRPESESILLRWREIGSDVEFDSSQASDGMLRTFALVSLLLQPEANLPAVLIIDEPELGLHPTAIDIVASLIKTASRSSQIIVATQSVPLLNHFDPNDVVVVERSSRESTFHRLDREKLKEWLNEYSLSQLWEKNVFGGGPRS